MSGAPPLIDRGVAERVAQTTIAALGGGANGRRRYAEDEIEAACVEAIALASALSGLAPVADRPPAELLDRRAWARNAIDTLAVAAAALQARAPAGLGLPPPLVPAATRAVGVAVGIEAGAAAGFAATRVLAQYDLALFEAGRPARLLFVGENLGAACHELEAEPRLFLRWIALHETTHVLQLQGVAWLAPHLRGLALGLLDAAVGGLERRGLGELAGRLLRAPGELVRAVLRGELVLVLADPAQRRALDRLQATMSVIEGHAEHVMDAGAPELGPGIGELRRRLDERRSRSGGLGELVGRLLGLELKLRQYEHGRRFCETIVAEAGEPGLRRLWRSPADLPDLGEIEHPRRWLERVAGASAGAR